MPTSQTRISFGSAWVACCVLVTAASADVRPPLRIRLIPEKMAPAVAGEPYVGQIEIVAGAAVELSGFEFGRGWGEAALSVAANVRLETGARIRIPFRATPTDPNEPLKFSVKVHDWLYERSFDVGPRTFEILERGRRLARLEAEEAEAGREPMAAAASTQEVGTRGGVPLQFVGRIVYTRSDGQVVGADSILFRVKDDDPVGSETIVEGQTDSDGYFDVSISWDDGGDAPDLFLEVEAATDVVDVEDSGTFENNYSWSTSDNVIEDFAGDFHDFGWMTPADSGDHPAIHIFNAVTRAHRYIDETAVDLAHVDAQWPEGGTTSFYDGEMHITANSQWSDWTIVHEYGHHYMAEESVSPSFNYCNGICDSPSCTHCIWCPETGSVHWIEGVPNWLADAVTRDWDVRYGLEALGPINFEQTQSCGTNPDNPLLTEGHVAALLRDIEDDLEDQDGDGVPDTQPACARDDLNLSPAFIFTILSQDQPTTVAQFIIDFRNQFPLFQGEFWRTCNNIASSYTWPENEVPGVVAQLDSSTHPLAVGGDWPVIGFEWTAAPDDASGVTAYSIVFGSAPEEPDMNAELTNGETTWESPEVGLGQYFLSLKARDCVGNWSDQWTFFGPFLVSECYANGIVDACETSEGCGLFPALCGSANCSISPDCNFNATPDTCEIASGIENDCNANGVPDSCETAVDPVEWQGCGTSAQGNPLCTWHQSLWEGGSIPGPTDSVCISDNAAAPHLEYNGSSGTRTILEMGSTEVFRMTAGTLTITSNAGLHNRFEWAGGTLDGGGTTLATGGIELSGTTKTLNRDMENTADAAFMGTGQFWIGDGAMFINAAGALFDSRTDAALSWSIMPRGTFQNDGEFRKTVDPGTQPVFIPFNNGGVVDVQAGTLSLSFGGDHTGEFVGPGTIRFNGQTHTLEPASNMTIANVEVSGGLVDFQGQFAGSNLLVSAGGTADFSSGLFPSVAAFTMSGGVLRGSDEVDVNGPMNWTGGTIEGPGPLNADGMVTLGGTTKILNGDMLSNVSTVWQGTGQLWIGNGAKFTNAPGASFDSETDASMSWSVVPRGTFQNDGEFRKTVDPDTQSVFIAFNNDGVVDVQTGALSLGFGGTHGGEFAGPGTIRFSGQTHTLTSASSVTAANVEVTSGLMNVQGDFSGSNLRLTSGGTADFSSGLSPAVNEFTLSGGLLRGTDEVEVNGPMTWTGGTIEMNSNGALVANGPVVLSGTTKILNSAMLNNASALWTGSGQLWLGNGGTFTNSPGALFDSQTDATMSWSITPRGTFQNDGEFRKSLDPDVQSVSIPFNNDGLVDVQTGILSLNFGGTHSGNFIGPGTLRFGGETATLEPASSVTTANIEVTSGLVEVQGQFNGSNLALSGGAVDFSGGQSPIVGVLAMSGGVLRGTDDVAISGPMTWTGGTIEGIVSAEGPATFGGTTKILNGQLVNTASAVWQGAGQLWIGNGGRFINAPGALFDCLTDAALTWSIQPRGSYENHGVFRKAFATGTTPVSIDFINGASGQVELLSGVLSFSAPAIYRQEADGLTILSGGTLRVSSPSQNPVTLDGGVLMGVGLVDGRVNNNAASVEPGLSAGTLQVGEDYNQAAGAALTVEIGGVAPGTEHDVLAVIGDAVLAGALEVRLIDRFAPQLGQSFTVLTAGAVSGQFDTLSAPAIPSGQFDVSYGPTTVTLTVVEGGTDPGDCDSDGDLDYGDMDAFQNCMTGPDAGPVAPACNCSDFDGDADADLADWAELQAGF